jgi:hypothetical protein
MQTQRAGQRQAGGSGTDDEYFRVLTHDVSSSDLNDDNVGTDPFRIVA